MWAVACLCSCLTIGCFASSYHNKPGLSPAQLQQLAYLIDKAKVDQEQHNNGSELTSSQLNAKSVNSCFQTLTEPGSYLIQGTVDPLGLGCVTTLEGPPNTIVRISVEEAEFSCSAQHSIQFVDGMASLLSTATIPYDLHHQSFRRWVFCPKAKRPSSISFSQNVAQIKFNIRSTDYVIVRVEFVAAEPRCNVYVNSQKLKKTLYMNVRTPIPTDCAWYIAGPSEIDVTAAPPFANSECGHSPQNYLTITADKSTWNASEAKVVKNVCLNDGQPISVKLRCGKILLNVHAKSKLVQTSVLAIRPLRPSSDIQDEIVCT